MPISDKILLQHIEDLLQEYLPNDLRIEKTEDQTRLTIGETRIWIECNEDFEEEILIGVEHRGRRHLGTQNDLVNTLIYLLRESEFVGVSKEHFVFMKHSILNCQTIGFMNFGVQEGFQSIFGKRQPFK
jgi:hypothetical protein